jgi:4-amino-4-deoxy-L-arabinose transferase-like glycosyltransferase
MLSKIMQLPGRPARLAGANAHPARVYGAIAVLAPAFFFLYGLDAFPLRDNNEGLYAGIARAMLDSGQYVVPQLNGVPYIEKPPLLYWLAALSMALLGATPAAARLPGAAAMLCLCLCLYQFCRLHGNPRAGCYASVGLASMVPVALLAHAVLFDPLLAALLGACLLCYLHGYLAHSRRAHLLAAFLLALAVLEKGGVALVLAAGVAGLFLVQMRERAGWRRLLDPAALALLVAVAAPWHVLAALAQEGFGWFYFINEHVLRFLGRRLPDDYHHGPLWFYLPRLALLTLPWTPLLLLLAARKRGAAPARCDPMLAFCKAGLLFPLIFFSLSQAKADYYLLVAMPALALWLALAVTRRLGEGGDRRLALGWGMSAASALAMLAAAPWAVGHRWRAPELLALALGWCVAAAAGAGWFRRLRSVAAREAALLAVVLVAAPALALLCREAGERGGRDSSAQLARIIGQLPQPRAVFLYRDFEDVFSTLPFYLGRPLPVIDSLSRDLQFGCGVAPGSGCIGAGQFQRLRQRGPVAVAVRADRAAEFLAVAGPGRWRVAGAGEKLLFFDSK